MPPSRHTPSVLALSERRRGDLWKSGCIVVCLAALALSYGAIRAGRTAERLFVMDPMGNLYAGPVEQLSESKRFFNVTAIYLANAALQRSASGFDLAELLKLYFTPRAIAKLEDDQKSRAAEMKRRNLQWKPLIESISEPVPAGSNRIIEIRGRLVIAGAFARRSFAQEAAYTLVLTLERNPDIGKSGAYPWVCNDIDLRIADAERSRR